MHKKNLRYLSVSFAVVDAGSGAGAGASTGACVIVVAAVVLFFL